jgi:hypothetical protein
MKSIKADLLAQVVGTYDQTKTTIQGRALSKIVDGDTALGPSLNKFVDVLADTAGVTPVMSYLSPNGRLYHIAAKVGSIATITCHTVNLNNGDISYVGMIRMQLADVAATTVVYRGFKVIDNGNTGFKIYVAVTGSVLINGGLYCVNNVDLADFTPLAPGTLFPFATGSNQKATYFLQDPNNIGVNQLNTAATGVIFHEANNRVYVHNGVAATHQYYVYSTNATLDCPITAGNAINDVTDRITQNGHGYNNNDPIFLTNLSGGAGLTNNTVYFVRNPTANDYQVSATSGGAAINITTSGTVDVCRAFGTTGDAFVHKTGNLPALAGTLVAVNSEYFATPQHTSNSGFDCAFFATSTNLYLGRLSELTSGATTWPSLVTSNLLGATNEITAPTLANAAWSNAVDRAVYLTNTNLLVMKQVVNNNIDKIFGGNTNKYRETTSSEVVDFSFVGASSLDFSNGWLAVTTNTPTGQRGTIIADIRSDAFFDYSYIVTKVLDTPDSVYKYLASTNKLYKHTNALKVYYRTSGFNTITGGWQLIPFAEDITSFAAGSQVQFKILFDTLRIGSAIPAQLTEFFLGIQSNNEISDNWEFSDDFSDNNVPSRTAFRLKKAYGTSVPTLYYRAYDLNGTLLVNHNTVANASNFQYSTDNGTTWLALGTIPNTVGTLVRYTFTSPPGVDVRPSLRND